VLVDNVAGFQRECTTSPRGPHRTYISISAARRGGNINNVTMVGVPTQMLTIERIEILVVSLPERRKHPTATRQERLGEYVITKVRAGGLVGLGEATVLKEWGGDHGRYYGEHPTLTARIIAELLAPAMLGEDAMAIERVLDKLDRTCKGYPYAKASLDISLHDLVGKALGVPVYQLLGGLYRRRIPIAHSLGILDKQLLLEEVASAVEEGARTIKLKVGLDPERDVDIVAAVRALVGDHVGITVDANQGWPTPKVAVQTIKRMEPHRILFAEQPVEGIWEMAQVARAVDTPIMADESAWTPEDVLEIARLQAADAISLYTTKPGGLLRARKMAAIAEAASFSCNVNGSHETGVGNAANLHLAAALKPVTEACVVPVSAPAEAQVTHTVGRSYLDDIITEPFEYDAGDVLVSSRPGLGIDLDDRKVAKYQQAITIVVGPRDAASVPE
jgi:muconate cycloisomerase